jgi:pyridinium-3,5-bisthiocarboxylic acid mononucleotide nickel chelatase
VRGIAHQSHRGGSAPGVMRVAHFDCFAGASGNMILGALVDAGLSLDALERELRKLPVTGWTMHAHPVRKHGLGALYLDVDVPGEDHHRHDTVEQARPLHEHRKLSDVLAILRDAQFPAPVEKAASAIYHRLAQAEARVHRVALEEIAFHEVGQVDAIVDIAGAAVGLYLLGIERVHCSAMPCGRGFVQASHGRMPSPAPATFELLRGVPTYDVEVDGELVTPTGAAILTTVASFEARPPMKVDCIGYGSGRSDFPFPNVLRVLVGEATASESNEDGEPGDVTVLETNIDDMNPQVYDHVMERVFAAGALDAWTHPVQMKKGRPGTQFCALAPPERANAVADALLAETTTIGVRRWTATRDVLPREERTIETEFGPVRIKIVRAPSGPRVRPEYEDCRAIARRDGLTLNEVMRRVEAGANEWLAGRAQ